MTRARGLRGCCLTTLVERARQTARLASKGVGWHEGLTFEL